MRDVFHFFCPFFVCLCLSCSGQNKNSTQINILTESESIYPIFADNERYAVWSSDQRKSDFYQFQVKAVNNPVKWEILSGSLPPNLTLSKEGKLSGNAKQAGEYHVVIKATDRLGNWDSKDIKLTIHDFRSKWLADAKFGIMIQWGTFTYPALQTKNEILNFEKRIKHFDADKWVKYIKSLGAEVLNFTVKGGDGVRLWPSKVPSKYGLNIKRNIVKELIDACHRNNVKFIAYFAPDHSWNKKVWDYYPDKGEYGTGELNLALVGELVDMGIDGIWVDMSALPEIYPNVDPKWFLWEPTIKLIRSKNPNVIIASNPGIFYGGTTMIDEADVVVYEGGTNHLRNSLAIARPYVGTKRRAVEVDNVLDSRWWSSEQFTPNPKPAKMIIENIEKNWKAGATYFLNYPVFADGDIAPKEYRSILEEIGTWVKRNKNNYRVQHERNIASSFQSNITNTDSFDRTLQKIKWSPSSGSRRVSKVTASNAKEGFSGFILSVGGKPIKISQVGVNSFQKKCHIDLIISRFSDDQELLKISGEVAPLANGLSYIRLPQEIVLNAGEVYSIAVKADQALEIIDENTVRSLSNEDFDVLNMISLNKNGKKFPLLNPKAVSFIDLNYYRGKETGKENFALSSALMLQSNVTGQELLPSKHNCFSFNAVDGDLNTVAQATGEYAWTFFVDMKKLRTVERIKLNFADFAYPTDFDVLTSRDGKTWSVLKHVSSNSTLEFDWNFSSLTFRYLRVKANKPDGDGQKGEQMGVAEIGIW
ncbi:alpha-L-fucosidase [Sphingobacterium thalpophilum]|uniref:alpha-L-fucosidase n=1 Tax=Sphingobacterium thalpophilum TaxID=259 RepID=UPI0024A712AC|nr:alpha-L-fucosidase [Sphingobacterium thalpophilum]